MPQILITGVSSGIGRACAELFSAKGWRVVGTVRDVGRARDGEASDSVELVTLDLDDSDGPARCATEVLERFGCPDVLLNNAGMLQFGPIEDVSPEEIERLFRVNVFGQIELVKAFLPAMRERGSGTIVNVTSLGGRIVFPFFAAYNATKWAMEGFSEGLWHELMPFGIKVKSVEPGFVETAIWDKVLPEGDEGLPGRPEYRPYVKRMREFESSITDRTSPHRCAEEILRAVNDTSDRLRYPVAAYAAPIVAARWWLGDRVVMRFFHTRWMGRHEQ